MSDTTAAGSLPEAGKISIGPVFSRTFGVLFANLVPFLLLAFLLTVPVLAFNLITGGGAAVADPSAIGAMFFVGLLISMVVSYTVMGALVFGTVQELLGQRAGIGECVSRGLAVVLPVIVVGFLVSILVVLGSVLLLVPGIIVFVVCAVAIPVAVVERPGIWASVKRSAELTKGNRWRIFGLMLIFYGGLALIGYGLQFAGLAVMMPDGSTISLVAQFVWSALNVSIYAVFGAVMYHDLRVAKEGVTTSQIAAVFD